MPHRKFGFRHDGQPVERGGVRQANIVHPKSHRLVARQRVQVGTVLVQAQMRDAQRQFVPPNVERTTERHSAVGAALQRLTEVACVGRRQEHAKGMARPTGPNQKGSARTDQPTAATVWSVEHVIVVSNGFLELRLHQKSADAVGRRFGIGAGAGLHGYAGCGAVSRHPFRENLRQAGTQRLLQQQQDQGRREDPKTISGSHGSKDWQQFVNIKLTPNAFLGDFYGSGKFVSQPPPSALYSATRLLEMAVVLSASCNCVVSRLRSASNTARKSATPC